MSALVLLGLQPACLLTAVILPRRGWRVFFASLLSPLPPEASAAEMLIWKERRVRGISQCQNRSPAPAGWLSASSFNPSGGSCQWAGG